MDATTPDSIPVVIAGRSIRMLRPNTDQALAISMAESHQLPDAAKVKVFTEMFLALLPTEDDRTWFVTQLATFGCTVDDMAGTLKQMATYTPGEDAPKAAPRKARKTAAKRP